jgi:D-inositol-3-phosphate glycosyltransferase
MYQTSTSKGQELVAQRMVRDFIALGHEAHLITSVFHDGVEVIPSKNLAKTKGYVVVDDQELDIPIIRVDSYAVKWPHRRINFRDFLHVLEKIVDEFKLNVLITHSTLWNGPEEVAKFIAWRRYMRDLGGYKDPIVFCHMSHFQEPSPKRYSLVEQTFRMAWNKLSLSQILKTANLILVVTPLEKDAKVKMGADPEKCFLFPGGVDEEPYLKYAASDAKDFLQRHKISPKAKIVSYLGTLEERKNPMTVLKVAELLNDRSDIQFVIAGRGDSHYAEKIKAEASRLPNVTYVGEIDNRDKILLIRSSYINILMSHLEALGLTQLEFMYLGIPVVTSGVGGQSWLIKNGREGIHTSGPEDADGAAKAIQNLADDHELWSKLSANAKERASDMTSSQIMQNLDEEITKEMIKESGLNQIPLEALVTLAEPEKVVKTWSAGSWAVVATDMRLFVKHGRVSRKVTEIPYASISYIEHTRRFAWKILIAGLTPTLIVLLDPLWRTIFKPSFISGIEQLLNGLVAAVPWLSSPQTLAVLFGIVPFAISLVAFGLEARIGFNLYGQGMKPIYLPHKLREVVTFIRKIQDKQQNASITNENASITNENSS